MKRDSWSLDQYVFPFVDSAGHNPPPRTQSRKRERSSHLVKERVAARPNDAGIIYAIGIDGSPHVKIGKTAGPVQKRIAGLQSAHPARLHVLATVAVEKNLSRIELIVHRLLAEYRQNGEWFMVEIGQGHLEQLVLQAEQWLEKEALLPVKHLNVDAQVLRKQAGSKPGKSRFGKLGIEERQEIGRRAVKARWAQARKALVPLEG